METEICPHICTLWPHTLFCGEETTCKRNEKRWEEGCGIITEVAMRGIVLGACAQLGRPIALLEEKPEGCPELSKDTCCCSSVCNYKDEDAHLTHRADAVADQFFRLECMVFYEHSNSLCKDLRQQSVQNCQKQKCYGLEARIAEYLLQHAGDQEKPAGVFDMSVEMRHIPDTEIFAATKAKWVEAHGFIGLRYCCPFSGYSDMAFLIEAEDIRAVLIIGQILFAEEEKELQDRGRVKMLLASVEKAANPKLMGSAEIIDALVERRLADNTLGETEKEFLAKAGPILDNFIREIGTRTKTRRKVLRNTIVNRAIEELEELIRIGMESLPKGIAPPDSVNAIYKIMCDALCGVIAKDDVYDENGYHPWLKGYLGLDIKRENISINPDHFSPKDPPGGDRFPAFIFDINVAKNSKI